MKKVSLLLVLVLAAITISAQDSGVSAEAGRKATFTRNGFWDNWFAGVGVGTNVYLNQMGNDKADFFDRPTVTANLQVGKWFNPYLGLRGKGTYGAIHTFSNAAKVMNKQNALTGEADVLFNASNYFGKYNENRFYSFIPYLGIGAGYSRGYSIMAAGAKSFADKEDQKSLTFNVGLINQFRLTERLGLGIELSGTILKEDFDRRANGDISYDFLANASANLVYKLGKVGFAEAGKENTGMIDDLNNQINALRKKLEEQPKVVQAPPCPPVVTCPPAIVESNRNFITNVVFFRIGSANIDTNQEVNIYNTAQYLKDNPKVKVKVVGYADKKTGTASINQKLSEKRAKNVANSLITKHNIESSRVSVEWKGDTVQPYAKNEWNRVAIFYTE